MFDQGYSATLLVNGQALAEYESSEGIGHGDNANTVHRYVEVKGGQRFTIRVRVPHISMWASNSKQIEVSLDGTLLVNGVYEKYRFAYGDSLDIKAGRILQRGQWYEKDFEFQKLQTTEHAPSEVAVKSLAKSVGTIKINVYDFDMATSKQPLLPNGGHAEFPEEKAAVPEKALKGKALDIGAGVGGIARPISLRFTNGTALRRISSFVFHAMSRHALQLLEIIPTTPEPVDLEDRDSDNLSAEELRQLVSQLRHRKSPPAKTPSEIKPKVEQGFSTPYKRWRPAASEDDDIVEVSPPRPAKTRKVSKPQPADNDAVEIVDIDDLN